MKFMPVMNVLLGTALVVPAITQDKQLQGGLEAALVSSVTSLENLTTIRRDLGDGVVSAVDRLMGSTEQAIMSGQEREERLRLLRLDVNRLQMTLDQLDAGGDGSLVVHTPEIALRSTGSGIQLQGRNSGPPPTAGLDDATRDLVRSALPHGASDPARGGLGSGPRKKKLETAAEFSASKLREGRLMYKSGRHEQALTLLQGLTEQEAGDGWEAKYWTARCYEKLGRDEEAIKQYEEITAADEAAGGFAQKAKQDYDFLVWKREFFQRRKDGK